MEHVRKCRRPAKSSPPVAVGTRVAPRPPHGSGRVALPHRLLSRVTAPTIGTWAAHAVPVPVMTALVRRLSSTVPGGVVCRHQLPATGRLPPPPPRPARPALFGASQVHAGRPTPRLFAAASPSRLPAVARDRQRRLWARPGLAASNAFAGMANDLLIFRPSLSQPLSPGATRESVSGAPGEHPVSRFISAGRAFN